MLKMKASERAVPVKLGTPDEFPLASLDDLHLPESEGVRPIVGRLRGTDVIEGADLVQIAMQVGILEYAFIEVLLGFPDDVLQLLGELFSELISCLVTSTGHICLQ